MGFQTNVPCRHARARAIQRYGVDLSLRRVRRQFETGRVIVFERERGGIIKMFVAASGKLVPIVYHSKKQFIITTLPQEAAEVMRAKSKLTKNKSWPSWCCQECGEPVGWLGRLFGLLRVKPFHFHAPTTRS